jgi:hypothetical protein
MLKINILYLFIFSNISKMSHYIARIDLCLQIHVFHRNLELNLERNLRLE